MDIRVVSSLNPEDEERIVPALLAPICGVLNAMPIAYTVQITTSTRRVFQHSSTDPAFLEGKATNAPMSSERARNDSD
jgi:hypothetical protein